MSPHPPSARRMRVAATIAAREAAALTDTTTAAVLAAWTPIYLPALPDFGRNPDTDPTDPGNE